MPDPSLTGLVTLPGAAAARPATPSLISFEMAKAECQVLRKTGASLPLLGSLLPGIISSVHPLSGTGQALDTSWFTAHMTNSKAAP